MSRFRVGVAGATGAVGKEVLAVLDKTPWRPAEVVAIASQRSETPEVQWGEAAVPVDDAERVDLARLDALILAIPPEPAREPELTAAA